MKNIFTGSNIKHIFTKPLIGKNKKNRIASVRGIVETTAYLASAVLALSIYKTIGAHTDGEVVPLSKEIHPSADHIFKLVRPLHFRIDGGVVDFVNIYDFADTIPSDSLSYTENAFSSFISHKKPWENFNEEFSDKQVVSEQSDIFYEKYAETLKTQYGISDIRNLTPQKLIVLAQFVTQNIVEYGNYFESLDSLSRYNKTYEGDIARAKLHSWANVGNSLLGIGAMLKKVNGKNLQTNGICHNYAAVFKTIVDVLTDMQKSQYMKENLSCTATTSSGALMEDNITDIQKHVWNTCYYRASAQVLQTVVIDVTASDSTGFKMDAYMDYTGERFLNEIWRFRNHIGDSGNTTIMNGLQDISSQIEDDITHVPKNKSAYRSYKQILKTIDIMKNANKSGDSPDGDVASN